MMSRRSGQKSLFQAGVQYLGFLGPESFYGFLAQYGCELFRDDDFLELCCPDDTGRPSLPSSFLALALLHAYDRVLDAQATQRAAFDLRWKVALGIETDERPFAKSTLQLFRAQLIVHDRVRQVFQPSLQYARETGYLRGGKMRAAVDSTVILGRAAVEDTENVISHGIKELVRVLAAVEGEEVDRWAEGRGLGRHFAGSIKGSEEVDWDEEASREAFLTGLIEDGERAVERTEYLRDRYPQRLVVEHRIARLVQLGISQSRYLGKGKTLFQVVMAATVANLTLIASHMAGKAILNDSGEGALLSIPFAIREYSVPAG